MKSRIAALYVLVLVGAIGVAIALADMQISPVAQAALDRQKQVVVAWAADPVIVGAVKAQNAKGPMPGMDNAAWKTTRRSDPVVKAFQANPAAQLLQSKLGASAGLVSEAFLNGSRGEKVAFAEKTTSYIHAGQPKFDVPYGAAKPWQGKPEFDESTQTYAIQISTPVVADGKPIGALVVGVNLSHLEKLAKK